MILDSIKNYQTYIYLHPAFEAAFKYLTETDFSKIKLKAGKVEDKIYEEDSFFVNMADGQAMKNQREAYLEVHDNYIDIQTPLSTIEQIGYLDRDKCKNIKEDRRPEGDIIFYKDKFTQLITLHPNNFIIFLPQDAHAPLIGEGKIRKIVVKVKI
jgi:YhcH/YjgK/YiaL family protein